MSPETNVLEVNIPECNIYSRDYPRVIYNVRQYKGGTGFIGDFPYNGHLYPFLRYVEPTSRNKHVEPPKMYILLADQTTIDTHEYYEGKSCTPTIRAIEENFGDLVAVVFRPCNEIGRIRQSKDGWKAVDPVGNKARRVKLGIDQPNKPLDLNECLNYFIDQIEEDQKIPFNIFNNNQMLSLNTP